MSRLLGQVERQIARLLEGALSSDGLTLDQWRVLDLLADGEGHPMSELAGAIVVPGPTLTKIVDKLVDGSLVYRLVDDRDRRRVLAFLSDKGRSLHRTVEPKVTAAEAEALAELGDDAFVLADLLAQLAKVHSPAGPRS
ncbi:MarR family winged helix-turn-helix transcriptional regulator [Pseudonocardia sp. WMMC193]|uniref:MarR family winged helix-turn-helix transcriptional regulator n=1 Tax=Pseudonocardia sp. WMMC193 TaxID=2911965 RepID=UPI001EFF89A5|nr:MarR family transcriptional regulator [Pseudonocardia sp. WMMC193]MCF7547487.1 MarR family transcriptional regulator [Pseudonocardia sp. WMMC193]